MTERDSIDDALDAADAAHAADAARADADAELPVGTVIGGKYRILALVGRGGMGAVYAAHDEALGREVAIKVCKRSDDPRRDARLRREARAAARIPGEGVARVYDAGELPAGQPYIVMELLHGEDVAARLRRGRLPIDEALGYALQAIEAVARAHAIGLIHRDLKPANLFLARSPAGGITLKVLDFGVAKSIAPVTVESQSTGGAFIGTPSYMAPEQMRGSAAIDARTDVWALGVLVYEMICGVRPFAATSLAEHILDVMEPRYRSLAVACTGVPDGLSDVVARCLQPDPAKRFPSVVELAEALAPFAPPPSAASVARIREILGVSPLAATATAPPPEVSYGLLPTLAAPTPGAERRIATLSASSLRASVKAVTSPHTRLVASFALGVAVLVALVAGAGRRGAVHAARDAHDAGTPPVWTAPPPPVSSPPPPPAPPPTAAPVVAPSSSPSPSSLRPIPPHRRAIDGGARAEPTPADASAPTLEERLRLDDRL